jgi:hypothetical protein
MSLIRQTVLTLAVLLAAITLATSSGAVSPTGTCGFEGGTLQNPTGAPDLRTGNIVEITPDSPVTVDNCIPLGNNTDFGFCGFIYRDVPAFELVAGNEVAFDLGALNNVDTRRNIYFASAGFNPAPPIHDGFDITTSQNIVAASGWTQIVPDSQVPQNPLGNNTVGDYELIFTAVAPFSFPGGGLIVGFGASPPGAYADPGCEQVLVHTTSADASGQFYCRFFFMPDQTAGVLDPANAGGGTAVAIGGIIIEGTKPVSIDPASWAGIKSMYREGE